ncbi:outer membrane protein assembly factor BamB [Gallaecimonas pentaromativorans]|uniref:Outer membrane protein assembly factor BamB n=1 Tax=Gallaecimonas pentaromativorans TaxID=584787 RepID=A0A3N1PKJ6_9GAMM|nr:outer membrane protein assembly factor BamB [Gallaecimonas pentaromativorans]MED5524649.1 outer membrane protein assembly factor BamB [Pseudomonadota bacterium]ROQ28639.1 Beta-barrel assembly machine subunit BamB [Gallaecimonas pentaromativorans]
MSGWSKWSALAGVALVALVGCSSNDEVRKPAELAPFDNKVSDDVIWSTSVGDGIGSYFSNLEPVYAYDKIFAASREGVVEALDPKTGDKLWKIDLGEASSFFGNRKDMRLSGGVSAGFGKIYIGSENGVVYALDEKTGDIKWQTNVPGEAMAAPVPDSGLVLVNTTSGKLVALEEGTGKQKWVYEQTVPSLSLRGVSEPSVVQGAALIGTPDGKLAAVLLDSGLAAWEQDVSPAKGENALELLRDVDATPIVVGPVVYAVAYNGELVAIDLRSGRPLWKRDYSSYRSMAIVGFDLIVSDANSTLYNIDRRSGLEKWSQPMLLNRRITAPAILGDKVLVGDFEGYLHWFDKNSGELLGRDEINSSGLYARPVVVDGNVLVQSRDGDLYMIKLD